MISVLALGMLIAVGAAIDGPHNVAQITITMLTTITVVTIISMVSITITTAEYRRVLSVRLLSDVSILKLPNLHLPNIYLSTYTYPTYTNPAPVVYNPYPYDPVAYDPWYATNVYGWAEDLLLLQQLVLSSHHADSSTKNRTNDPLVNGKRVINANRLGLIASPFGQRNISLFDKRFWDGWRRLQPSSMAHPYWT